MLLEPHPPPPTVLPEGPEYEAALKFLGITPEDLQAVPQPLEGSDPVVCAEWQFRERRRQGLLHKVAQIVYPSESDKSVDLSYLRKANRLISANSQSERMIMQRQRFTRKIQLNIAEMKRTKRLLQHEDALSSAQHEHELATMRDRQDRAQQFHEYEKVNSALEVVRRAKAEKEAAVRAKAKEEAEVQCLRQREAVDANLEAAQQRREQLLNERAQKRSELNNARLSTVGSRRDHLIQTKHEAQKEKVTRWTPHEENRNMVRRIFLSRCAEDNKRRQEKYDRAKSAQEQRTQQKIAAGGEKERRLKKWEEGVVQLWKTRLDSFESGEEKRKNVLQRAQQIRENEKELQILLNSHREKVCEEHIAHHEALRNQKIALLKLQNEEIKRATARMNRAHEYREEQKLKQWDAKHAMMVEQERAINEMWDDLKKTKEKKWGAMHMMKDALRSKDLKKFQMMLKRESDSLDEQGQHFL